MKHRSARRLYAIAVVALAALLHAAPARAQYQPKPLNDPATGETYHIEGAAAWWFPSANIVVSSEQFNIPGSSIDFKTDLGLQDQKFGDLRLVLRPSKSSKFRFEFIPITYNSSSTLHRTIVFNGISYNVGLPVNSLLQWKAYRIGYEYDFIAKNRGYAGFIVEAKVADVKVQLDSPIATEFAHAQAPIPAIGGVGRVYVVPNISITGEVTGFKLPQNLIQDAHAHYVDVDVYGTVNFTNNVGAQLGYRSLDVGYLVKTDSGVLKLKGLYFGVVARY
jgi:hypothetical protein